MVMNRLLLSLLAVSLVLVACDKEGSGDDPTGPGELIERKAIPLTRAQLDFVKWNNTFALEFFKRVAENEGEKSMLVSPISVTFALGMVNNGAKGDTQAEINKALGYGGKSIEDLNAFCKTMLEEGAAVDPTTTIEIANMAVINKGSLPLKDSFTKKVESNFKANVCYKDFGKEDVKSIINQWCEEKTHGMIKNFLKDPITPDQYAHFLNATYFKGIWSSPFNKDLTHKEDFTAIDGNTVSLNMMLQQAKFGYSEVQKLGSAVCLPYGNKAYRMIVILPGEKISLEDLKNTLTIDSWNQLNIMSEQEVEVCIPSFESEFGASSIKKALMDMGIKKAFVGGEADFSDMTNEGVYVSDVLQKAKIKVDEQGTEAAAVTDVVMEKVSSAIPKVVHFHADRPFLYAITEVSTGAIFFIGQYTGK